MDMVMADMDTLEVILMVMEIRDIMVFKAYLILTLALTTPTADTVMPGEDSKLSTRRQ